MKFAIM